MLSMRIRPDNRCATARTLAMQAIKTHKSRSFSSLGVSIRTDEISTKTDSAIKYCKKKLRKPPHFTEEETAAMATFASKYPMNIAAKYKDFLFNGELEMAICIAPISKIATAPSQSNLICHPPKGIAALASATANRYQDKGRFIFSFYLNRFTRGRPNA